MRAWHGAWLLLALAACDRSPQPDAHPAAPAPTATTAPAPAAATALQDISERNPNYLIGISFAPALKQYPALAALVLHDAQALRADFLQQVAADSGSQSPGPYDLSLDYSMVAQSPRIVAVAAEGSRYVGGAHGEPLLERYVWMLPEQRRLTAGELVPDPAGWGPIAAYAREQLLAARQKRIRDDAATENGHAGEPAQDAAADAGTTPAANADSDAIREQLKDAADMIAQGTEPEAANFADFEPVLAADGRIAALRFVFPPYQVGPYSDGAQAAVVPAAVLLPQIAPALRGMFVGG